MEMMKSSFKNFPPLNLPHLPHLKLAQLVAGGFQPATIVSEPPATTPATPVAGCGRTQDTCHNLPQSCFRAIPKLAVASGRLFTLKTF